MQSTGVEPEAVMPCELKMIVAKRQIQKGEWHTDTCESSTPMLVVLHPLGLGRVEMMAARPYPI